VIDRFYPIVDSARWVGRLLGAGARLIQLRVKDRSDDDIAREISAALDHCARAGAQLVVNDYWRAAIDAGASYVHLGQGDLDDADIPRDPRARDQDRDQYA
jgi:thiamine monophosphate synthase